MKSFRIFADRQTTDKVNDYVYGLFGSVPADNFVAVHTQNVDQLCSWLDHIGVQYEEAVPDPVDIPRGHLVANHIMLATFGRS